MKEINCSSGELLSGFPTCIREIKTKQKQTKQTKKVKVIMYYLLLTMSFRRKHRTVKDILATTKVPVATIYCKEKSNIS